MNAIGLILEHHRTLEELFEEVDQLTSPPRIRELVDRIAHALEVHLAVEEEVFYEAIRASHAQEILRSQLEEHVGLKQLLADLAERAPDDPSYTARLGVLEEQVQHHFDDEEIALLPKVRRLFDEAELEALGRQMAEYLDERAHDRERSVEAHPDLT